MNGKGRSCCIEKILINSITPPTIVGENYILNTNYCFNNILNKDRFIIILPDFIDAQKILGNVVIKSTGTPNLINLETNCTPNNLISDQLTNLGALCTIYGSNSSKMKVTKAISICDLETELRKSAGFATSKH
ncbi:MAG: hypothetical protein RR662_07205 [Clostridia bacterium]